jgi:hypothetical protein
VKKKMEMFFGATVSEAKHLTFEYLKSFFVDREGLCVVNLNIIKHYLSLDCDDPETMKDYLDFYSDVDTKRPKEFRRMFERLQINYMEMKREFSNSMKKLLKLVNKNIEEFGKDLKSLGVEFRDRILGAGK